jgi:hypothetical protein
MASSQPENWAAVSATKFLVKPVIALIFSVGSVVCAQAQDARLNNANESWTATTQTSVVNNNPSRTTESQTKSGNRSVDKVRLEQLDLNGRYQPVSEIETETVQVDPTTTRTVVRTYRWDLNGQKNLMQVTEEEARGSASGDAQVVRTTSNCDAYGNLQVMEREVTDTRQTSPNAQETKTTFFLLDANGDLTPSAQTKVQQTGSADHTVETKKTKLLPDSSGSWQVSEVKESIIKEDGKNRTSEDRILGADSEGRLSEVSRTVGRDMEAAAGEQNSIVEKYSTEIPGLTADGSLHLNLRVSTVQKKDAGVETSAQQVEQPNPGDPKAGLQVSAKTEYIVQYSGSGTQETKTTQVRDVNGTFNLVFVETRKSDQVPTE